MSVLDSSGRPVSSQQALAPLIQAINTLGQRTEAQQMQLLHLGMLIEYLTEKLASVQDANGNPLFKLDPDEFEKWSQARYEEVKQQAQAQRNGASAGIDLE